MPLFAIVIVALLAVTALVVDMGFLFGQRRYDQNGADAAALAAARHLAESASPLSAGEQVWFAVPDTEVYSVALNYVAPNQNPSLAARNTFLMTLEYLHPTIGWCSSPAGPAISAPCPYNAGLGGINIPPDPDPNQPYRIRVTVSSATDPVFAPAGGIGGGGPAGCPRPGAAGADAHTTCAFAEAVVEGCEDIPRPGPILPVVTADCDIYAETEEDEGFLHVLWGSGEKVACVKDIYPNAFGNWQYMVDLSTEDEWCDGVDADKDYTTLMPSTADTLPACSDENPDLWDRAGFETPSLPAGMVLTGEAAHDVPLLVAAGGGGNVYADYEDGNKLPTFDANLGENVAQAFYCKPNEAGAGGTCPVNDGNSYFFGPVTGYCADMYGAPPYNAGCRDAVIISHGLDSAYTQVEWYDSHGVPDFTTDQENAGPDRVRAVRLLTMRLYCEFDAAGNCTKAPGTITGNNSNSLVWGRFKALFYAGPPPPGGTCGGGPRADANTVRLVR